MHSRLRSDLQTGLLVVALLVGVWTSVARERGMRARRDLRAAELLLENGTARFHPEASAALGMVQGARDPASLAGVAGLIPNPHRPRQVSVATAAQALLLRLPGSDRELPPNTALVADVRAGASVPAEVWSTAGAAGLVALEAGRAGRVDLVSMLVSTAASGPSVPDRLAAQWALARLGYDPEGELVTQSQATQVVP